MNEDDLRQMLHRRAETVRPDPEGWNRIAERIEPRPARRWGRAWGPQLAAAALVVAVAAVALVARTDDAQDVEGGGGVAAPPPAAVDPGPDAALPAAVWPWPGMTPEELVEQAAVHDLTTPESAAVAYVADRLGAEVEPEPYQAGDPTSGEVVYRVPGTDGAGQVFVRRHDDLWYVAGAATDVLPVHMGTYDGDTVTLEVTPTAAGDLVVSYRSTDGEDPVIDENIAVPGDGSPVPLDQRFPDEPGIVVLLRLSTPDGFVALAEVRLDAPPPGSAAGDCSAAGGTTSPPDQAGLPDAVAATRRQLVRAAATCDYDRLAALADHDSFDYTFGGGDPEGPAGHWRTLEASGEEEPLRLLAGLLQRPHGTTEVEGSTWYVWPPASLTSWADVSDADRESLRPLYDDGDFATFEEFGSYIGYRVAIDETGRWRYFIAGD